jgi:hypothetical protein
MNKGKVSEEIILAIFGSIALGTFISAGVHPL